jgi:hypothetical protein
MNSSTTNLSTPYYIATALDRKMAFHLRVQPPRHGLTCWTTGRSFCDFLQSKKLISNQNVQTRSETHQFFFSKGTGNISRALKHKRHKPLCLPSSVDEVKNELSCTSTHSSTATLNKPIVTFYPLLAIILPDNKHRFWFWMQWIVSIYVYSILLFLLLQNLKFYSLITVA